MLISAIIPNYNHAKYLQQRIESVLQQTRNPDEIIILDDCSTDKSVAIIEAVVAANPSISFIQNTINSDNTFKQWNKGIELANGDFIWMAESDDVAEPEFLYELEQTLLANPQAVLAYCQSKKLNDDGEVTGSWQEFTDTVVEGNAFHNDFVMDGKKYLQQFLIHRNTIPNASAVLFSKKIFDQIGGANETLKTNADWLVWLRMSQFGDVSFLSTSYNYFRYHNESVIAKAHASITTAYKEQYDGTMRKLLSSHLHQSKDKSVIKFNKHYISIDNGQKGLHYLRLKQWIKGWNWIMRGSMYGNFKTGFIKKALGL